MERPVELDRRFAVYAGLFLLSLACVARVVSWPVLLAAVVVGIAACDWKLFQQVDYALLATFLFFFILVGNLQSLPSTLLSDLLQGREVLVALLASRD